MTRPPPSTRSWPRSMRRRWRSQPKAERGWSASAPSWTPSTAALSWPCAVAPARRRPRRGRRRGRRAGARPGRPAQRAPARRQLRSWQHGRSWPSAAWTSPSPRTRPPTRRWPPRPRRSPPASAPTTRRGPCPASSGRRRRRRPPTHPSPPARRRSWWSAPRSTPRTPTPGRWTWPASWSPASCCGGRAPGTRPT